MSINIDPVVGRLISRMMRLGCSHGVITAEIKHETGCDPAAAVEIHSAWLSELRRRMQPVKILRVGDLVEAPYGNCIAAVIRIETTAILLKAGRKYWQVKHPPSYHYLPEKPAPEPSMAWVTCQLGRDGVWDFLGQADSTEQALEQMSSAVPPYEKVAMMSGTLWRAGIREPIFEREPDFQIVVKLG